MSLLSLQDNGAGSGPMIGMMNDMLGDLLPTDVPAETGMGLSTIDSMGNVFGDGLVVFSKVEFHRHSTDRIPSPHHAAD